jgi:hypothetical protein
MDIREFRKGISMPPRGHDDVIDYTPESGFMIENLAATIVQMMQDLDMDAHINLPDGTVIEVEKDCTEKEIIKGYKDYMAGRIKATVPSNKNERETVK